jgi:hypothetical protein
MSSATKRRDDGSFEAAADAVEQCAPLEFSSDFASGIGGKVFTMRFAAPRKKPAVPEKYASA